MYTTRSSRTMCSRRQDFNVNKHHTIRDSQRSAPSYATCIHGRRILLHICLSHKVDNDQASLQGSQLLLSMQNSTTFNEATFKDHSGYAALIDSNVAAGATLGTGRTEACDKYIYKQPYWLAKKGAGLTTHAPLPLKLAPDNLVKTMLASNRSLQK